MTTKTLYQVHPVDGFENLLNSGCLDEIPGFEREFDMYELMGIQWKEQWHSNVLAWMLEHRFDFQKSFFSFIQQKLNCSFEFNRNGKINAHREFSDSEYGRIDVVAHYRCTNTELVVGIEVKVLANEGGDQIKRYQELLSEKFSTEKCCVVFLTLDGHSPKFEDSDVKVIPMSWKDVSKCIEVDTVKQQDQQYFLKQFKSHLERITSMNSQETEILKEFLQKKSCNDDHRETIRRIVEIYPKFDEYKGKFRDTVAKVLGKERDELIDFIYRENKICRELKVEVEKWKIAGLPITFMLFDYDFRYEVRILLHNIPVNGEKVNELNKYLDEDRVGMKLDFQKISEWDYWCTVLPSDHGRNQVDDALIKAQIYEDKFWKFVEEKLESQAKPLVGPIDKWIEKQRELK